MCAIHHLTVVMGRCAVQRWTIWILAAVAVTVTKMSWSASLLKDTRSTAEIEESTDSTRGLNEIVDEQPRNTNWMPTTNGSIEQRPKEVARARFYYTQDHDADHEWFLTWTNGPISTNCKPNSNFILTFNVAWKVRSCTAWVGVYNSPIPRGN